MNTLEYHKNNPNVTLDERDDDLISILGVLHSTDVIKLLDIPLQQLSNAVHRKFFPEDVKYENKTKIEMCKLLQSTIIDLNMLTLPSNLTVSILFENIEPQHVHMLSKSQLQMILYRKYASTDSNFRNTYGQELENLRNEVTQLVDKHHKEVMKTKNQTQSYKPLPAFTTMDSQGHIYITIDKDSKDLALQKMSYENTCQEIFRLTRTTNPSITLEQLHKKKGIDLQQDLKRLRDELLSATMNNETEFIVTSATSDNQIQRLNKVQMRFAIIKFAHDRKVIPDTKFIEKMTKLQLILELKGARDVLKSGSKETPIPTLVRTKNGNKSQKELTQNLCGADITNFDVTKSKKKNQRENKDANDIDKGYGVASSKQEKFTVHAKIETKSANFHAPTIIKSFIVQMRKGDSMLQVVPVEKSDYSSSEILEGNNSIPDDKDAMSVWITNLRTVKTKLYFTMKITTIDIATIRSVVYAWCKGKGTWIDFTSLGATTKFFGGWFHKLSPYYHNIDHFANYIYDHKPELRGNIDIYQKQIYAWSDDNKKIIRVGVVIDGDITVKETAFKFLYEHKWSGRYKNVNFIPYSTSEVLTRHFFNVIEINNTYNILLFYDTGNKSTYRKLPSPWPDWDHQAAVAAGEEMEAPTTKILSTCLIPCRSSNFEHLICPIINFFPFNNNIPTDLNRFKQRPPRTNLPHPHQKKIPMITDGKHFLTSANSPAKKI